MIRKDIWVLILAILFIIYLISDIKLTIKKENTVYNKKAFQLLFTKIIGGNSTTRRNIKI